MQGDGALSCAACCASDHNLRVRTIAAEDEPVDRVGEAIIAITVGHEIRGLPHFRIGIAHGNAKTTTLEHRDVIATVANDGDLRQRNHQQPRNLRQRDALVGERFGPLVIVGLITLAISMAVFFGVFAVMGIGVFALFGGSTGADAALAMGTTVLLAVLIVAALLLPLAMATWFAPPLVLFHDMAPLEAMKTSFAGCLKNMLPFLIYGVVLFVAAIVATIPLGLGWLVLGPVLAASVYTAYRDLYFTEA